MQIYHANVVSKATNTPMIKLQRYFERGHIRMQPCDLPSKGSGECRGYSKRRMIQIAIATELTWLGIGPSRAAEAAFEFSDRGGKGREIGEPFKRGRTFLVGSHRGENKIVNIEPDGSLDDIFKYDNAAFVVDVGKILKKMISNMETAK